MPRDRFFSGPSSASLEAAKAIRLCWHLAKAAGADGTMLRLFRRHMRHRALCAVHLARRVAA